MRAYPLESITIEEARQFQFRLIDSITKYFKGAETLSLGDLGVVPGLNKPSTTLKVETVLADFFGQEAAVLVRGAGTAAIRNGLYSMIRSGKTLLVHKAPIYPTTQVTIEIMGLKLIEADFNNMDELKNCLNSHSIDAALIQYTRQKVDDAYDIEKVIQAIKECIPEMPIITDDNYAVMKVKKIGAQCGADLSAFSLFKLLGPEGIGCVTGKKMLIDKIIKSNYSGGGQVQGHEAMDALRGLVYAPVALAIQAEVNDELIARLNGGEVRGVKNAFLANAQSKVLLVEFDKPVAKKVLNIAESLGAAPNPVGAESKYEIVPMFYRVSGTFRAADSTIEERMIRINPMRAGADTIMRILKSALEQME